MNTKNLFIAVCLLLTACSQQQNFTNPVIRSDVPDPTIILWQGRYYAAATSGDKPSAYPAFVSDDMVHWQSTGHIFPAWPEWTEGAFWAPELFVNPNNGKTYCYYTARAKKDHISCIGVASADKPTGPFTDHGELVRTGNEAIDSYVFRDTDGTIYITWKAYGLTQGRPIELLAQRLSPDGLYLEGKPFTLLTDVEDIGMEGQCIVKRGNYYFLLYSARDCCSPRSDYEVRIARATSFAGPYEKYAGNPILMGDGTDIQSCGHGTIVETAKGRMFYLCHAYEPGERWKIGRQAILQELVETKDGWLRFKTGQKTVIKQKAPKRDER